MSIKYNLRGTVLKSKKYHKSLEKSTDEIWKKVQMKPRKKYRGNMEKRCR